MRVLPILAGLILLGRSPALGDDQDKQEIKRLQERLELIEAKLAVLMAAPPPAEPVVRTQNVALPPMKDREPFPPLELVPEIGKLGAQVGLVFSGAASPFHFNTGQDAAAFIDLPLFEPKALHGKIGYEIRIGLSQSKTKFVTTSNVAQVANLAVLTALQPANGAQNLIDATNGTGASPYPVKALTETRSKLLQIIPFSLKYTSTYFERLRLRPYAVVGLGMYVMLHHQTVLEGGVAPFAGSLVAGQIAQSPELTARGLPIGAGNLDFGVHTGGGLEFRLNRNLSLAFDSRYNRVSGGQSLTTFGPRLGFHF